MQPARRETLTLVALGLGAAVGGAILGVIGLQAGSGTAELLATPLLDLQGRSRRLREWHGHVLLCNFWATWCEPCREEVPLLVETKHTHASKGLEIAGIGIDNAANLGQFYKEFSINYPVLVADGRTIEVMRRLGNTAGALPYTVILDRRQSVVYRRLGALHRDDLSRELAALMV